MIEYADAAGFVRYHKAEHHFTPLDAAPSATVFLAAASQRTRRIRLGSLVSLLPFYHPVRFIEEVCALDHLSGGRLDVGVGKGISPIEHRLWGHDDAEAMPRTLDAIEILRTGLTQKTLTHASAFHTFDALPMLMSPKQRPHPPLWYPGNVEFAGSHRLNTVVGGPIAASQAQVARFDELVANAQLRLESGGRDTRDRRDPPRLPRADARSRARARPHRMEALRREPVEPVARSRYRAGDVAEPQRQLRPRGRRAGVARGHARRRAIARRSARQRGAAPTTSSGRSRGAI